jgi:hypothetical protein
MPVFPDFMDSWLYKFFRFFSISELVILPTKEYPLPYCHAKYVFTASFDESFPSPMSLNIGE